LFSADPNDAYAGSQLPVASELVIRNSVSDGRAAGTNRSSVDLKFALRQSRQEVRPQTAAGSSKQAHVAAQNPARAKGRQRSGERWAQSTAAREKIRQQTAGVWLLSVCRNGVTNVAKLAAISVVSREKSD
jgi:hypothetical protein